MTLTDRAQVNSDERGMAMAGFGAIGGHIRRERKKRSWTLRDLAGQCGISVSFLSQLERGMARPSVGTLHSLAEAFGMSMAELLEAAAGEHVGTTPQEKSPDYFGPITDSAADAAAPNGASRYAEVVRADRRKTIIYPGSGIRNEMLTPDLKRALQMMWVIIPVGESTGEEGLVHAGEECGVVLQGRVGIWVGPPGDEEYLELGPGDAVYQLSTHPHRSRNIGDVPALIVTAITPPSL